MQSKIAYVDIDVDCKLLTPKKSCLGLPLASF